MSHKIEALVTISIKRSQSPNRTYVVNDEIDFHKAMMRMKIPNISFFIDIFGTEENWEYVFINKNEFQLFRSGCMPVNYVVET